MKIKEILKKMDGFSDEERRTILGGLMNRLCHISKNQLMNFQSNWDGSRAFEEFKREQNKVIKECVGIEVSEIGSLIREKLGLPSISLETEI